MTYPTGFKGPKWRVGISYRIPNTIQNTIVLNYQIT